LFSAAGFKILWRWRFIGRAALAFGTRGDFLIDARQKFAAFLNKARALLHLVEKLGKASHNPRHAFTIDGVGAFKLGELSPYFLAVCRHAESSHAFPKHSAAMSAPRAKVERLILQPETLYY
jgi:hypothetical protein